MNISRNVLLAALVAFGLPVFADDQQQASQTQLVTPPAPAVDPVTPPAPAVDPATTPDATTEEKKEATAEEKGFVAKVCAVICAPFIFGKDTTLGGIDWLASTFGAERFAKWLASASKDKDGKEVASFFAGREAAISRTLTVAGMSAAGYAAYQAWKAFVAEEDADEEYADVDVFGDDFEVGNN